jgi:hypothetical protein
MDDTLTHDPQAPKPVKAAMRMLAEVVDLVQMFPDPMLIKASVSGAEVWPAGGPRIPPSDAPTDAPDN